MINLHRWNEYIIGMQLKWPFSISIEDMSLFSKLSGDYNPLHTDSEFAQSKEFEKPVVYGLLLSAQMSRLIGQELPDQNSIIIGIQMDFISPCFPNDELIFVADLIAKSESTHTIEFKCTILRSGKKMCKGSVSAVWKQ